MEDDVFHRDVLGRGTGVSRGTVNILVEVMLPQPDGGQHKPPGQLRDAVGGRDNVPRPDERAPALEHLLPLAVLLVAEVNEPGELAQWRVLATHDPLVPESALAAAGLVCYQLDARVTLILVLRLLGC